MGNLEKEAMISNRFREILSLLGEDSDREGLKGTPGRFARFMLECRESAPFEFTTFDAEGMENMVVEKDIPFYSLCEHHCLPFFGTATVAYVPRHRIAGLSKLARAVGKFSAGLQNQERITKATGQFLQEKLETDTVAVSLKARHMCMEFRGAKAHGTTTVTSFLGGSFKIDPQLRSEYLSFIH